MSDRGGSRGAIVLLGTVVTALTAWLMINSPIFAIREVRVVGNGRLTSAEVLELGGVRRGNNLFRLSPGGVEDGLLRSPWVADARVDRRWPSTVVVRVEERRPVAWVRGPDGPVVVSGDGTALPPDQSGFQGPGLPSVGRTDRRLAPGESFAGGPSLRVAASLDPELAALVARVRTADGQVVLDLHPGGTVLYGTADAAGAKNAAALALIRRTRREGIEVGYVDVRDPSSPVLNPAG
jgi:cell division protein FtsQ